MEWGNDSKTRKYHCFSPEGVKDALKEVVKRHAGDPLYQGHLLKTIKHILASHIFPHLYSGPKSGIRNFLRGFGTEKNDPFPIYNINILTL